jgi:hypothetical protein
VVMLTVRRQTDPSGLRPATRTIWMQTESATATASPSPAPNPSPNRDAPSPNAPDRNYSAQGTAPSTALPAAGGGACLQGGYRRMCRRAVAAEEARFTPGPSGLGSSAPDNARNAQGVLVRG